MDDDQLTALMHDAVSDVRPRHGVDEVRERLDRSRDRHASPWLVAAAMVATAATVAAVTIVGTDSRHAGGADDRQTSTAVQQEVPVYFVSDAGAGPRLFRETHATAVSPDDPTLDAVQQAVGGRAHDPDYRSDWPSGTEVVRVTQTSRWIVVGLKGRTDLTERPGSMSAAEARIAVQQLVYTAQGNARSSHVPVRFEVDGVARPRLLGVEVAGGVPAASADGTLAEVSIETPRQADNSSIPVTSPFTVQGKAAAFEGNVQWELKQGDTVVRRGSTTARECCTLSPYSFTVTAPRGDYTLVVHDEDPSDGEGARPSRDTKAILVQ